MIGSTDDNRVSVIFSFPAVELWIISELFNVGSWRNSR